MKILMKAARANAELTQGEVARRMHKSQNTVMAWETHKIRPRQNELQEYCDICGCPIEMIRFPEA